MQDITITRGYRVSAFKYPFVKSSVWARKRPHARCFICSKPIDGLSKAYTGLLFTDRGNKIVCDGCSKEYQGGRVDW